MFLFWSLKRDMKKFKLKWFTLVEMLIVMVIIGILAVVLTESYIRVSRVALRVEQEKNLSEESLILTQVFQAISDEATIDYERYGNVLSGSNWFTGVLYLTWWQWSGVSIYTTGICLDLNDNFEFDEDWILNKNIWDYAECSLILEQNNERTQITTPWKVVISKVMFRIIPYDSDDYYFYDYEGSVREILNQLHQPAFWMFVHLYTPLYQPVWTNKIDQPLQLFFNLKL